MSLNFDTHTPPLPVSGELLALLRDETAQAAFRIDHVTVMTMRFEDPGYSPERGGFHPVHIRLVRGLNGWIVDSVTDFCFQGPDSPLRKELDFNLLDGEYFMLGWGWLQPQEACEVFTLWQRNFVFYYLMRCFSISIESH
ncbi:MAG: DUF2787 family protein [Aeromonadaceae bacterium]